MPPAAQKGAPRVATLLFQRHERQKSPAVPLRASQKLPPVCSREPAAQLRKATKHIAGPSSLIAHGVKQPKVRCQILYNGSTVSRKIEMDWCQLRHSVASKKLLYQGAEGRGRSTGVVLVAAYTRGLLQTAASKVGSSSGQAPVPIPSSGKHPLTRVTSQYKLAFRQYACPHHFNKFDFKTNAH